MLPQTRRSFNKNLLGSLAAYGLIECISERDAFADKVKPLVTRWMQNLNALSKDLKADHTLKDTEFQNKLEELYRQVELPELLQLLDLDKLAQTVKLPDNGTRNVGID